MSSRTRMHGSDLSFTESLINTGSVVTSAEKWPEGRESSFDVRSIPDNIPQSFLPMLAD